MTMTAATIEDTMIRLLFRFALPPLLPLPEPCAGVGAADAPAGEAATLPGYGTEKGMGCGAGTETGVGADTVTGPDAGIEAGAGPEAGTGTGFVTEAGEGVGAGVGPDVGTDPGLEAETGLGVKDGVDARLAPLLDRMPDDAEALPPSWLEGSTEPASAPGVASAMGTASKTDSEAS